LKKSNIVLEIILAIAATIVIIAAVRAAADN